MPKQLIMKIKNITILLLIQFFAVIGLKAQLTPNEAIKLMGRGVNMGNTLEPPDGEGTWGNPAVVESNFDDYKNAGFTCVRLPITWDKHTSTNLPYTIDAAWLNRIEQIIDWGLNRNLIVIINAHHEDWIKNSYTTANVARLDSIWSQISKRFKNKSEKLFFEVINEPNPMLLANVNALNAQIINTIRKTNKTRIVIFSGHKWSNSEELIAAAIPNDSYQMGYYHSYDPWPFGLEGTGSYGTDADLATTKTKFDQVSAWSTLHNIPVVLGEFGATYKCDYNSRMCLYATDVEYALTHNIAFNVWEDGGDFKFYDRTGHNFTEIKDILICTYKESPNRLKISNVGSSVKIQWQNRTTQNDSIMVERKTISSSFTFLTKISPTALEYIDNTVEDGTTYYYRLKTNIKDSILIQSYPIMIKHLTTALDNHTLEGFLIYPNPAYNQIAIKGINSPSIVNFYHINSELVKQALVNEQNKSIAIDMLPDGLYILKYTNAQKSYSTKLIKMSK